MNKSIKNIVSRVFAFLLIGAVFIFVISRTANLHIHKLADGTVIVHSHPYDKTTDDSPYKSHHHNDKEFSFIQTLNVLYFFLVFGLSLILISRDFKEDSSDDFFNFQFYYFIKKGRAPPLALV
jgi:hypothetical protein